MISIPKACEEDWDKMNPSEGGRHCAKCKVNLLDLDLQSPSEIINDNKTGNCVSIDNEYFDYLKSRFRQTRFLAALLLVFGGTLFSNFTYGTNKTHVINSSITDSTRTIILKGKLLHMRGKPHQDAEIKAITDNGEEFIFTTDEDGSFNFELDLTIEETEVTLEYFKGYRFCVIEKETSISDIGKIYCREHWKPKRRKRIVGTKF